MIDSTKNFLLLILIALGVNFARGQSGDSARLKISGYAEIYYSYDFNRPLSNDRPVFIYSHNRHNEVNANLAFVKAAYDDGIVHGNLALMTGTYANANLAAEPGVLKNIYEANIGLQLCSKVMVDAGILPSHIGFESAISKDCWSLTRSILADNSPYYESGVRVTYTPSSQWTLVGLALNGWQRIRRVNGNSTPALGTQVTFKPNDNITLNYSTFLGNDKPDSVRQTRFFNNFYAIIKFSERFGLTTGFDFGVEKKGITQKGSYTWYSPVLIARYKLTEHWTIAGRMEQYADKNGVIIVNDFKMNGISFNLDYAPGRNALLRIEGRWLKSHNNYFQEHNGGFRDQNFCLSTSLALSF